MKKISVILTTYNSGRFIVRTIESILGQQGADNTFEIELIVVDDCSSDNTVEILKSLGTKHLSTRKNSGGPNFGRNIGLTAATGDYICIADHDDVWEKHKIITLLPYLEKVPLVTSGYTLVNFATGKTTERFCKNNNNHLFFEHNQTFLSKLSKSLKGQNTYLGSIIYSKDLKHIRFEEEHGMVDFDWILRMFHRQESIEVCQPLYLRYVSDSNLSLNERYRNIDFNYSLMTVKQYQNDYPGEVKTAYKRIHGSMARYYYVMGKMEKARSFFLKSELSWKTLAYWVTTFFGAKWVVKKFNVFG
ncbi:MAG: glycosyltransferase family 2 protein [Bacteroidales bacterium]|nr:glycosyltransferase family 2 protein [Bacteroidales bacterium]